MSDGGKGSKPRPFSVTQKEFDSNWNKIFKKNVDNTGTDKNEYYDILSTEDCFPADLEEDDD
jgi:hypothetical protein